MSGVLDASAVLAVYFDEPGAEIVRPLLPGALVSAVNYTEALSKALDRGSTLELASVRLASMGFAVVAYDAGLALRAAALRPHTKHLGLAVGDRACLALAEQEGLPVYTADRAWAGLPIEAEITVIR